MYNPIAAVKSITYRSALVPYLTVEEVRRIAEAAKDDRRNGERNYLLIRTLFETGLRISEALSLTPRLISDYKGHAVLHVRGKGNKPRMVARPDNLAHLLRSYTYIKTLDLDEKLFDINRQRGGQEGRGEQKGLPAPFPAFRRDREIETDREPKGVTDASRACLGINDNEIS